jgi:predicted MPP superfamily phosphohydrolase
MRIHQAIRSSHRSDGQKTWAIRAVSAIMGLLFALNTYVLFRPIPWVDPPLFAQIGLFYAAAVWNFGALFSGPLLLVARASGLLGRAIVRLWRGRASGVSADPANPGRRRFLQAGVGGIAAAPILLSGYGAAYAAKTYDVQELTLPFGLPLRVVQLTDIHAGLYMTRDEIRRYADQAMALQPELFVLTGDYISNSMAFLRGCLEELARVQAPFGTIATLGNHEHLYGNLAKIEAIFREHGIPLLINAHRIIQAGRAPFAVAGIDDIQWGSPDLGAALSGLDPAIPTLLLSHRPEIFPQAAARGIPLTLAGHWHGGQVKLRLPGTTISFAHYRTPYPEGLFRIRQSHLYVSRGIGTTGTPVRLNAPPEVTVFHLT